MKQSVQHTRAQRIAIHAHIALTRNTDVDEKHMAFAKNTQIDCASRLL